MASLRGIFQGILDKTDLDEKLVKGFKTAKSNLTGNVKALTNRDTRRDWVRGATSPIERKLPGGFEGAANRVKSKPLAEYFVLSPAAQRTGIRDADYLKSRTDNPYLRTTLNFGKNMLKTAEKGGTDMAQGVGKFPKKPVKGTLQATRGFSNYAAMALPGFREKYFASNLAASLDKPVDNNDLVRRAGSGFLEGMTGIDTDVPDRNVNFMGQEFDPVKGVGQMVGYVNNPQNKAILNATGKIFPTVTGDASKAKKALNWLGSTFTRGVFEDIALNYPDMPDNLTTKQKAKWMLTTGLQGGAMELGGQAITQGGGEVAQRAIRRFIGDEKALARAFDYIKSRATGRARSRLLRGTNQAGEEVAEGPLKQLRKIVDKNGNIRYQYKSGSGKGGQWASLKANEVGEIEKLATDPFANLAELSPQKRKAVLEYRFINGLDDQIQAARSQRVNFKQDPNNPNRYLRVQPEQMYGAADPNDFITRSGGNEMAGAQEAWDSSRDQNYQLRDKINSDLYETPAQYSPSDSSIRGRKNNQNARRFAPLQPPEVGYKDIRGQKAESPEEVGSLLKDFRNSKEEIVHLIYTKNGKVIAHNASTSKLPNSTGIDRKDFFYNIEDRMGRLGADGLYLAHNHPSGKAEPSRADTATTNWLQNKFKNKFKGSIVLDHDQLAVIKDGEHKLKDVDLGDSYRSNAPKILSPKTLKDFASEHWNPDSGKTGLFIVNSRNEPVGYESFKTKGKSIEQINDSIKQFIRKHRGVEVFLATNDPADLGLKTTFDNRKLAALDVLVNKDGNLVSLQGDMGMSFKGASNVLDLNEDRLFKLFDVNEDNAQQPSKETLEQLDNLMNYPKYLSQMGYSADQIDSIDAKTARGIIDNRIGPQDYYNLKPKTTILRKAEELEQLAQPKVEQARAEAEMNSNIRSQYSKQAIKDINRLKQYANSKAFAEGDIETLRKKTPPHMVDRVVEAVREARIEENLTDEEALNIALNLPTKADTRVSLPEEMIEARELRRKAKQVKDKVFNSAGNIDVKDKILKKNKDILEKAAIAEYKEWERQLLNQSGADRTPSGQVTRNLDQVEKLIRTNTKASFAQPEDLEDIGNVQKGFADVYRIFEKVYKKAPEKLKKAKEELLDPFDKSKGDYIRTLNNWAKRIDQVIIKGLGIKKGSEESAAVQLFGEGKVDYKDLVRQFGVDKADQIVKADNWFRQQYDNLLDQVNSTLMGIYPNNPDKIIPKRKNYYRHFFEMANSIQGLKNIFGKSAKISPELEGISATTRPKMKWLPFAQKRTGEATTIDAVGGFMDYLKAAEYVKNIDPHINRFRQFREEIINATNKVGEDEYAQLNNFINFLDKFANDLSGKTNDVDRIFQEFIPGGRKSFRVINWLNNRVKANVIVGNLSSSVAQFFNVPQGVADAGVRNTVRGMKQTLLETIANKKIYDQSDFMTERFESDPFSKFDEGLLSNTKKFAIWITGVGDEIGTKLIWNAEYQKALQEGIDNPVKYADDMTRKMVAGRGIGETPLVQKAKTFQLIAPFQLEVANLWWVFKDWAGEGNKELAQKMVKYSVTAYLMNKAAEKIRGSGVTFDPIQATIDAYSAYQEEDDKRIGLIRAGGRATGEVLSNFPVGQSVAGMYPEYGNGILGTGVRQLTGETITREELFGDADPTKYGSGLLSVKGLQDPLYKIVPSYGGQQIKRTLEGLRSNIQGYSETPSGRVRFPIQKTPGNFVKSAMFGQYSTPEARAYFDEERSPLGDRQSQLFKESNTQDAQEYYNQVVANRSEDEVAQPGFIDRIFGNKQSGSDQRSIKIVQDIPEQEQAIKVLYSDAQSTLDSYEDNKIKIQYGVKEFDTDLDRREALTELEQEKQKAQNLITRIKQEQPEKLFNIQIDKYDSGDTDARAQWAGETLKSAKSEKEYNELLDKMLKSKVISKTVAKKINERFGLNISRYNYGGKIKSLGGSGSGGKGLDINLKPVKAPPPLQLKPFKLPRININSGVSNKPPQITPYKPRAIRIAETYKPQQQINTKIASPGKIRVKFG